MGDAIESFFSSWGPLAGATVYYDPNNDFDFANDTSAITAKDGTYQLAIPPGSTTGQIVVVGGTDQSTGLTNAATLTAPLGAHNVSIYTTLVNDIMQQTGADEGTAILEIQGALGLAHTLNPINDDYIKQALGGDTNAAGMFATEVQLAALSYQVDTLLSAAGGGTPATISISLFNNIAALIAQSGGAPLDLTDPTTVQSLIHATAQNVGVTLDPTVESGAATIVAGVNQYISGLPLAGSLTYLNQVVQAQVVAENTIAPMLAQVIAGTTDINTVLADETGTALAAQIAAAPVGSLDLDGPTLEISNLVQQPVGNGDPSTMQFTVYLAATAPSSQPISVDYTTQDNTATAANGDYTPVSGTITWQPGDTSPKTISVPISPTSPIAPDKLFDVVLSNPVNATIESGTGIGDIQYTDFATTTTLTSSTTETASGQSITLTATVTNEDPANDAGNGFVTFYDGTTALGAAPLMNGVATLTTSIVDSYTHKVTASYDGYQEAGANFAPSTSNSAFVTIDPALQTIDFTTPAEVTYGTSPLVLNATASSGLPVSYSLVSGPATITGDLLTVTGAGTVFVEVSAAGDSNNVAATDDESIVVDPAPLTFTVDNQSMVYGGTLPELTGSFSGFVNGDDASVISVEPTLATVSANSGAGSYAITASGDVAASSDYTITYVTGTLTITPAPLTVSADAQTMTYGGTLPTFTATYYGLVNGDKPASLTTPPTYITVVASSQVGSYAVTPTGAVDPNYAITYVAGTLSITPAALTITAINETMTEGAAVPTLTASYTGLVNGDTPLSLTTPPVLETNATSTSTVAGNPFEITVGGAVDPDYTISYVNGTMTVVDTPLANGTVSATGGVEGASPTSLTATFSDANAATISDFSGTISWGDGNPATSFTSANVTANGGGS